MQVLAAVMPRMKMDMAEQMKEAQQLYLKYGITTVQEGAAMAHVCYLNRIPFVIIRSISDNADGSAGISYNEFKDTAAKNSSIILEGLLTSLN